MADEPNLKSYALQKLGQKGLDAIKAWEIGAWPEADRLFREALEAEPKNADIWLTLGAFMGVIGQRMVAITCHKKSIELEPNNAVCWHAYGATMGNIGAASIALHLQKRALELDPKLAPARDGYAMALQKCHMVDDASREYEKLLLDYPDNTDVISHLCFTYLYQQGLEDEKLHAAHRYAGEVMEKLAPDVRTVWPNQKYVNKRLRVGFFSADFREHSCAYFLEPLLRHLDKCQFEVYLYSFTTLPDRRTEVFKGLGHNWREYVSHGPVLGKIREDQLDVAFDLGGHTAHYLKLFASRLAPVQISYLGYPATTGLTRMDYRFTDEICDPVGTDQWHSEKLYRLPAPMWSYQPPEIELRASPATAAGHVTFGSFNNFGKMTDGMLALWGEILAAVPTAHLVFKSTGLLDKLLAPVIDARLDKAKLDPARVLLIGNIKGNVEHLEKYGLVDIALDPSPFSGVTTTCEALWCGCPVVTLAGTRHSSRTGMSLLSAIGREEWIARNPEEYVAIAAKLASDIPRLAQIRGGLREEMKRSPLMDYARQAKRFGDAIRQCWKEHCEL